MLNDLPVCADAARPSVPLYLDEVERLLIQCALEHWDTQLDHGAANAAYSKAGAFTKVQITKLLAKLKESTS